MRGCNELGCKLTHQRKDTHSGANQVTTRQEFQCFSAVKVPPLVQIPEKAKKKNQINPWLLEKKRGKLKGQMIYD